MSKYIRKTEDYRWYATRFIENADGSVATECFGGVFRVPVERAQAYRDWAKGKDAEELNTKEGFERQAAILSPRQHAILERKTKGCLRVG